MPLFINTNINSLQAQQHLGVSKQGLADTLLRLSSGSRLNNASDDPAGLAISQNMQRQIGALNQGVRNGNDGVALVQTATGSMQQILSSLQRMSTLANQALNGTYSDTPDRDNIDKEYQALLTQIGSITSAANYNGVQLLDGTVASLGIQVGVGSGAGNQISLTLANTTVASLGLSSSGVTTAANASTAFTAIATAITTVTNGLAELGANQSGLNAVVQANSTYSTNLTNAQSLITNADYAEESSNLAKFNVLTQAGIAMLAQANSLPQMVLQLLQ
ncbi:MAG: flagellin [Gammaproteobacteria bacterium]